MKFKALDTETREVRHFDCEVCPHCKKWLVENPQYKYCQYCGKRKEPAPFADGTSSKK